MKDEQVLALEETKSRHQQRREERDQRFRKVVLGDPELSAKDLAQRFGVSSPEILKWCERLTLPKPPSNEGIMLIARPNYFKRERRKGAHR